MVELFNIAIINVKLRLSDKAFSYVGTIFNGDVNCHLIVYKEVKNEFMKT